MKSGTNLLQGTVYTFFRNGALDATNYFAPKGEPNPEYQRTQSGFSIGGPIVRDRTFFFADYEATRADEGLTRVTTVPTDAARNALPPSLTHPVGRAIAALYPSPNRSTQVGNYVSSPTQRDRTDYFDIRSDTAFGGAFDLMTRYSFADRRLFEPFSGPGFSLLPGYGSDVARRGQNFVASATHILSANLLNETRVGFNRVSAGVFPQEGSTVNRDVGLPEPWTNTRDAGLSLITVSGYSPLGHEDQQSAAQHDQYHPRRRHADVDAGQPPRQGGIRRPHDSSGRVSRRAGAGRADLCGGVHRKPAGRSPDGTAHIHDAGASRQSPAPANRVIRVVRAGQLSCAPERHALGRPAVRPDLAAGRCRRSRHLVRPANRRAGRRGDQRHAPRRLQKRSQQLGATCRRGVDP